ncbi:hypothetical protein RB200_08580 [Streptomyces sp. PmtG]
MGRREKPVDPAAGPVERFAHELRELRRAAGAPTYRAMAARSEYSVTALAYAVAGEKLPSLAVALAYVEACGGDPGDWEPRWQAARRARSALPADDEDPPPYQGLARFEPGDRELFFGRERLTGELEGLTRAHRVVAVFGPSGSGKSSLLRAGLIPRLQEPDPDRRGPAAIRVLTPGPRPARTHGRLFDAAAGEGDTWLVVDQFEEVFTLCRDPGERERFLGRLLSARDPRHRLRVVLGVRADFYGHCLQHRELARAVRDASLPVAPMGPDELRAAIVRPAAARGLIVERALTARLIEETLDQPGGLPLTSHALLETWRRRQGRTLTMAAYEACGEVAGALARTAEDLCAQLPPHQRSVARRVLLRLITPGDGTPDTRRPVPRAEFETGEAGEAGETREAGETGEAGSSGAADGVVTAQVLDRLARARLITLDHDTVDLAHEAVIAGWPRLRAWIEEDRERLRCHRRLTEAAEAWRELGGDGGALYRGTRLATADEHFPEARAHPELTALERDFLTASTTARDQERRAAARVTRRLRRFTAALSALLVLVLTASLIAWQQSRDSDRERDRARAAQRVAQSRQLAAQSATLLGTDPDLAALLAVGAHRAAPTPEAASSLYAAAELPLRHRLTGHEGPVLTVAFGPGGRTVATGGGDGKVRLWNAATGALKSTLSGHTGDVYTVAFSPGGRTLATGGADGTVRLWDTATGETRTTLARRGDAVFSMAFSPDGRTLASGGADGSVRLSRVATGRTRAVIGGHTAEVSGLAFSPDGRTLATGGADKAVRLWNAATGRRKATLTGHTAEVSQVAFSPDGRTLASGGYDRSVRLWHVGARRPYRTLTGHTGEITSVAFGPDGRTLATGGADKTVRLWNPATGRTRTTLTGHTAPVSAVAFAPGGRALASGGYDRTARLWSTTGPRTSTALTDRAGPVSALAFSPDGRALVTVGDDGAARLWDVAGGRKRATLAGRADPVLAAAFAPGGRTLTTVDDIRTVRVWDAATGRRRATLSGPGGVVTVVALSPGGRTLAVDHAMEKVRLLDAATGATRATLSGHTGEITALAFSPDGRTLASSSGDRTVRLWDTATGRRTATLGGHTGGVTAVAFAPDGRTLASGDENETVRLWNTATGRTRTTLTSHTGAITALAFSPDGRTLASGSGADRAVRLWDTATGRPRTSLGGHAAPVRALAFGPGGRTLATGGDGRTLLWRLALPTAARAARAVCAAVGRELTRREHAEYLPDRPRGPLCAGRDRPGQAPGARRDRSAGLD